jgi:NAD(P)-dependent dehydrogenase (short-subunit alcohol dehydrogenase family)
MKKSGVSDLKGKVAIITGGAGVLGSAMAKGLCEAGAFVGILGRTSSKINSLVETLLSEGKQAIGLVADVLNEKDLHSAREKIMGQWGKIDILINAAGGNMKGATIMPDQTIFDLSIDDFDLVSELNLKGTLLPVIIFSEEMAKQKKGSIINISSITAQQAVTRVVGYSASKAAIDNLTKWLAVEMAHKYGEHVRVNAIAPGFFIGEQNRDLLVEKDGKLTTRGEQIVKLTPMKRFGNPDELVGVVNWLSSDAASFVTGIVVPVDGGFSAFSGV